MNDTVNTNINSNFFTNRSNNTLMKEFEGILQHNPNIRNLFLCVHSLMASIK